VCVCVYVYLRVCVLHAAHFEACLRMVCSYVCVCVCVCASL